MTENSATTSDLRLICTTDLHMALDGTQMLTGNIENAGLANLVPAIAAARNEVSHSLLFDIGDAFQGSPLTDDLDRFSPHPMQQAFERVGYDAQTIGNHDLDFGLEALQQIVGGDRIATVCANLLSPLGVPLFDPYRILTIPFQGSVLRIGITGIVPPRVMRWNSHHLSSRVRAQDSVQAVQGVLPELLAAGADIIVVLAHCGIVPLDHDDLDEQAALPIAKIEGVDAILCGHQHRIFPGSDFPATDGIDPIAGTLAGKPAIMAGWAGQRIGILDLSLKHDGQSWAVADHKASFRRAVSQRDPEIAALAAPYVDRTRARLDEHISKSATPLSTVFSAVSHCTAVRAVQAALLAAARQKLSSDLPLLAVSAPYRCGGRSGAQAYTSLPAGTLGQGAVADLCPFSNWIIAVEATGAQVVDWLEMSSLHLAHLRPDCPDQPLINPDMPGYNFDSALGLSYAIDPLQPPRYSVSGRLLDTRARRIVDICYNGQPLDMDQRFAVITNSYRIGGGGNFPNLSKLDIIHDSIGSMKDLVTDWLRSAPDGIELPPPAWYLKPSVAVDATYRTGAGAPIREEVFPHILRPAGQTPEGWHDWDVSLRPTTD